MNKFSYTAKSRPGASVEGVLEAESGEEAVNRLVQMGYFPISVRPERPAHRSRGFFSPRVRPKDITFLTRQIATLLEAGIPVMGALESARRQTSSPILKSILDDILSQIRDGRSLSESLAAHPSVFSSFYVSSVRTGESGGHLQDSVGRVADYLEKTEAYKSALVDSLTYPAFVLATGVMTVWVLLYFVIPKIIGMFQGLSQTLPLPTRILIEVSSLLRQYGFAVFLGLAAAGFLFFRFRRTPRGRRLWERWTLRLPALGGLILKSELGRFTRMMSLLLSGGMPIVPALETAASGVENGLIRQEIIRFRDEITGGLSFSDAMKTSPYFSEFAVSVVSLGEETGSLDGSLKRIADVYEKEVDAALKTTARLIEPVVILLVGLFVGFLVMAMLLPIFEINFTTR